MADMAVLPAHEHWAHIVQLTRYTEVPSFDDTTGKRCSRRAINLKGFRLRDKVQLINYIHIAALLYLIN
jgi:hypothetical protein